MSRRMRGAGPRPVLRPYPRLWRCPWFLAPPRRLDGDLDAPSLILHTIQTAAAYEVLRLEGTLVGDASFGDWHEDREFREAYAWMRGQMHGRWGTTSPGMVWLWARTSRRNLVGDCRRARRAVLLTVRVPRERLLLSHFDDWHTVLNRSVNVPLRWGESFEEWSTRFDEIRDAWDHRDAAYRDLPIDEWPPQLRRDLEQSWLSIFEPHTWGHHSPCLQATTHELYADEVIRVRRIA